MANRQQTCKGQHVTGMCPGCCGQDAAVTLNCTPASSLPRDSVSAMGRVWARARRLHSPGCRWRPGFLFRPDLRSCFSCLSANSSSETPLRAISFGKSWAPSLGSRSAHRLLTLCFVPRHCRCLRDEHSFDFCTHCACH